MSEFGEENERKGGGVGRNPNPPRIHCLTWKRKIVTQMQSILQQRVGIHDAVRK